MSELDYLADRQAVWSTTANHCKERVDLARKVSFALAFAGAALAAFSTQTAAVKLPLSLVAAVALALSAFLTARLVNRERVSRHVRARAASEALKREAFLYTTQVGDYSDPVQRAEKLAATQGRIEEEVEDLVRYEVTAPGKGSVPRADLDLAGYIERRLRGQIKFYRTKADAYASTAGRLRAIEVWLALAAALLAAVSTNLTDAGVKFDFAATTAVLTTLGGTVLAHLQASHYDDMIGSYRATARRLERIEVDRARLSPADLVLATENAIQSETQSWSAFWSKEP